MCARHPDSGESGENMIVFLPSHASLSCRAAAVTRPGSNNSTNDKHKITITCLTKMNDIMYINIINNIHANTNNTTNNNSSINIIIISNNNGMNTNDENDNDDNNDNSNHREELHARPPRVPDRGAQQGAMYV